MILYTEKEKDFFVELYQNGRSAMSIQKEYGVGKSSVQKWAYDRGFRKAKRTKEEVLDLKKKIKDIYLSDEKHTAKTVANLLGESVDVVEYHIDKMKIGKGKGAKTLIKNVDYFENIDTEFKAYWLGWIMADGNVSVTNGQYSLKFHISSKDKALIYTFLQHIESTNSVSFKEQKTRGKYTESCYVSLTSVKMVKDLMKHGVCERKTGKERIPKSVPKNLVRHFIRGFFDGDGHAYYRPFTKEKGSSAHGYGFTANRDISLEIQEFVGEKQTIYQKEGVCQFSYGKKKGLKLYKLMYDDCNIWLPRKKEIMEKVYGNTELIRNSNMLLTM